jgi:hypothetical protein
VGTRITEEEATVREVKASNSCSNEIVNDQGRPYHWYIGRVGRRACIVDGDDSIEFVNIITIS